MRRAAKSAARLHAIAMGAALLSQTIHAQTLPTLPDAAATGGSAAYVDRVMDLPPEADEPLLLKATSYDESGWSRGWRIESATTSQRGFSHSLVNQNWKECLLMSSLILGTGTCYFRQ